MLKEFLDICTGKPDENTKKFIFLNGDEYKSTTFVT